MSNKVLSKILEESYTGFANTHDFPFILSYRRRPKYITRRENWPVSELSTIFNEGRRPFSAWED